LRPGTTLPKKEQIQDGQRIPLCERSLEQGNQESEIPPPGLKGKKLVATTTREEKNGKRREIVKEEGRSKRKGDKRPP